MPKPQKILYGLAFAWLIITGALLLVPNNLPICIACVAEATRAPGVVEFVIGGGAVALGLLSLFVMVAVNPQGSNTVPEQHTKPAPVIYPFTQQRIDAQARGNVNALILGSLAYAKARGHGGHDWATFIGQDCQRTWTSITTAREAAAKLALDCASSGMQIVSLTGDETRGEAITSDWPAPNDLAFFGLAQPAADEIWDLFTPIAQSLGLHYTWRREGSQLHFAFARVELGASGALHIAL